MKKNVWTPLLVVSCLWASPPTAGLAGENGSPKPAIRLDRGITIDRQVHAIPPAPDRTVHADDVRLVKSLGFDFVKLVFNPVVFKSGDGLDASHLGYFDEIVGYAAAEKLPVVVCIHPEWKYKEAVLGDPNEFASFLGFMKALSRHLADRWTCDQLVLQLMTEPPPAGKNPDDWNYWDKLQRRLWQTVRAEMPNHTLILSGDMGGSIEGMQHATPVDDENVLYGFTFYEPNLFAWQGDSGSRLMHCLKGIPFPSGPETLTALPAILGAVPQDLQADVKRRVEEYAAQRWDREKVAARIAQLDAWRQSHGGKIKLWCAEFGCHQGAPAADRVQYIELMRTLFDKYHIGWSYWSFNEDYSVMTSDRTPSGPADAQTPDKAILGVLMPDKYPASRAVVLGEESSAIVPTSLQDVQVRGELRERMERGVSYLDQASRKDLWSGFVRALGDDDSAGMWGGDWPGRTLEAYAATSLALGRPSSRRFAEVGYGLIANQAPDGSFPNGMPKKDDPSALDRKGNGFWFGNARAMDGLIAAHIHDGPREPAWLESAASLGDYYASHYFETGQPGHPSPFWWVATEALAKLHRETGKAEHLETGLKIAESVPPIHPEGTHMHGYILSLRGIVQLCEQTPASPRRDALLRKVHDQCAYIQNSILWPGGGIIEHLGSRAGFTPNYWFDEGCAVCDWLGLNLDLWRLTRESHYLDMAERVALNHFLFDQDAGGGFCGDRGVDFVREGSPWPFCCAMHGTRTLAELTSYVALTDHRDVWLGLFYPATTTLTVAGQRMVFDLDTKYPSDGILSLTIREAGDAEIPIHFRAPLWSRVLKLTLNDQAVEPAVAEGYCTLKRRWAKGDRAVLQLDLPLRTEARNHFIGDGPNADASRVSLWKGPRQLVFNQELNNHLWKLKPGEPSLRYVYQSYEELHRNQSAKGQPIRIGSREYAKGLGVHAVSEVVFYLGGQFKEFRSDIGVDAAAGGAGSVRFKVCVDGVARNGDVVRAVSGGKQEGMVETLYGFAVSAMTGKDEPRSIRVPVEDAQELRLVVDEAVDGASNDIADWADARLVRADGSEVWLSDLPDMQKLGIPSDWITVKLAESESAATQANAIALVGMLDGTSVPVQFSYLADLGAGLIKHRPVLTSWLRAY